MRGQQGERSHRNRRRRGEGRECARNWRRDRIGRHRCQRRHRGHGRYRVRRFWHGRYRFGRCRRQGHWRSWLRRYRFGRRERPGRRGLHGQHVFHGCGTHRHEPERRSGTNVQPDHDASRLRPPQRLPRRLRGSWNLRLCQPGVLRALRSLRRRRQGRLHRPGKLYNSHALLRSTLCRIVQGPVLRRLRPPNQLRPAHLSPDTANERRILWHRRLLLFLRRLRWRGTHASRLRKRHLDGPDSGMQFHHVHRGGRHDDDTNLCGWKDLRAHHQRRWRLHGPASVRGQRLRQGPHLSTVPPKPVGQLFCELFPLGRGNRLLATLLLRPRPRRLRLDDDWPVRSQSATSKAAPWAWARSIVLLLRHRPPASL
jgi:hypothetical protein